MKFVKYEGEIKRVARYKYSRVKSYLTEFMNSDIKTAEVIWTEDEYSSVKSAYNSLIKAVRRYVLPIDIVKNEEHIYLVRRDM